MVVPGEVCKIKSKIHSLPLVFGKQFLLNFSILSMTQYPTTTTTMTTSTIRRK